MAQYINTFARTLFLASVSIVSFLVIELCLEEKAVLIVKTSNYFHFSEFK
jgi:hypothetical protein